MQFVCRAVQGQFFLSGDSTKLSKREIFCCNWAPKNFSNEVLSGWKFSKCFLGIVLSFHHNVAKCENNCETLNKMGTRLVREKASLSVI